MRFQASSQKDQPAQWPTFQRADFVEKESHPLSFHSSFVFLGGQRESQVAGHTCQLHSRQEYNRKARTVIRLGGKIKARLLLFQSQMEQTGITPLRPSFLPAIYCTSANISPERSHNRRGYGRDVNVNPPSHQMDFL